MVLQVIPRRPAWGAARASLQRLVTAPAALRSPPQALLIGLEHEFRVFRGDEQVDFGELIHTLPIDGLPLDPGDRDAYRCRSGIVIAADTGDAEIAIPPLAATPGFTRELRARADAARRELEGVLPPGLRLVGATSHISISVPDECVERVAAVYTRHFVPALMLLAEPPESYGVMIRPRNGRLELCTGFVDGDRLEAYAAFGLGSTLAALAAGPGSRRHLPREIAAEVEAAAHRLGHQVRRTAFGVDLYAEGRRARLRLIDGAVITAQAHLEEAWAAADTRLRGIASPLEIQRLKAVVRGHPGTRTASADGQIPNGDGGNPFGDMLQPASRPGFRVEPVLARWEAAVFRVESEGRQAYAGVPGRGLHGFLAGIESGRLDARIGRFLSRPDRGSRLECHCQLATPALFASLGDLVALVRPEFAPTAESLPLAAQALEHAAGAAAARPAPAVATAGAATHPEPQGNGHSRNGKTRRSALDTTGHSHPPGVSLEADRFSFRTIATIVAGALVVLGGAGGALALVSGGGDESEDSPAASQSPNDPSSPSSGGGATSPTSARASPAATGTVDGVSAATPAAAGTATQPAGATVSPTGAGGGSSPTATATATATPTSPPPTATSTPVATATPVPVNLVPVVPQLRVTLAAPVSTYSITASDPEGGALTYTWQMTGEGCGRPLVPWTQSGPSVTWSHSSAPPDSCAHQGTNHAVTVTVTVSDSAGPGTRCTIAGSDPQVINAPACQPLR